MRGARAREKGLAALKRDSTASLHNVNFKPTEDSSSAAQLSHLDSFKGGEGEDVTVEEVLHNSRRFPIQFPVHTNRLENLLHINPFKSELRKQGKVFTKEILCRYINSSYPLVHERFLPLLPAFLQYKVDWGEEVERELYEKLSVLELVEKLIRQRPVVFINSWDHHLLLDGAPGFGDFEFVGKDTNPKKDMSLDQFNSYDEMRLAALISFSSMSPFINDGSRNNCGVVGNGVTHELDGAIIGQVGARFEKEGFMDWHDCIVKEHQNTVENGYGKDSKSPRAKLMLAWAKLWGREYLPTFEEVKSAPENYEYIHIKDAYLDKQVYKARMQLLAEIMLIDASKRVREANRAAYLHVSGIGLNEWMISPLQNKLYVDAWSQAIQAMPLNVTSNIACINFSDIPVSRIHGVRSGEKFPHTNITVKFTKRQLLERVPKGCLLVCNYSADANAMPGNEFWMGSLSTAGGPAAACASSIAELHNPLINPRMGARHMRIASRTEGVVSVSEFMESQRQGAAAASSHKAP
ncbi:Protein of unknown function DUF4804 [Trinorchestia longiramus]|nr:Protein of unknown function DUF4804 [Trinorchestia longiramus]